jgi:hypothetical protein
MKAPGWLLFSGIPTYRSQPTGYRAFHPAPLPPDPPLRLSGALQVLLSLALMGRM